MKPRCTCGGKVVSTDIKWKGHTVPAWECEECGMVLLHPVHSERLREHVRNDREGEIDLQYKRKQVPKIRIHRTYHKIWYTLKHWGRKCKELFQS